MNRLLVAPQEVLRDRLKTIATGEEAFDASMAKVWVDGVESLNFLLSAEHQRLLRQLKLDPPQSIPDLAHSAEIELSDATRQLRILGNYHLVRFEGKDSTIIPVAEPGPIEVTIF